MRASPRTGCSRPTTSEGQYRLHEAVLRLRGVPVPGLRWLELDPSVLGMPFYVMERVDGRRAGAVEAARIPIALPGRGRAA